MATGHRLFTKKRLLYLAAALLLIAVALGASFLLVPRPTTKWSYQAGPYTTSFFSPIESLGLVYLVFHMGASNALYALDANSGQVRWSSSIIGLMGDAPIAANGLLYVVTEQGAESQSTLHALDARSGREEWFYQHALFSVPAIGNGIVSVHSIDGNVLALDARSGRLLWSVQVGMGFTGGPVVVNHLVYVTAGSQARAASMVFALDAASGVVKWSAVVAALLVDQLSVVNGLVYVAGGGASAQVWALDAVSGQAAWSAQLAGSQVFAGSGFAAASFQVLDGIAYVDYGQANLSGTVSLSTLYALDARTGQQVWAVQTVSQEPTIANGKVYTYSGDPLTGGKLSALDARSGRPLWSYAALLDNVAVPIEPEPAVENGRVYVWVHEGNGDTLYALNAVSGSEQWSYQTGGFFTVPPTAAQGNVYALLQEKDGLKVEAIQPPGGPPGFSW